jgi:hypothetical protein
MMKAGRKFMRTQRYKQKTKPLALALAFVLSLATVITGATFAWFTAQDDVTNHLETNHLTDGDVKIQEVWNPEDGKDFEPGTEVNKDVGAINTGDTEAFVRISFEEVLEKLTTGTPVLQDAKYDGAAGFIPQQVNIAAYTGWTNLRDSGTFSNNSAVVTALNAYPDLEVVYKVTGTNIPGSPSGAEKRTYNFAAYVPVDYPDTDADGNPITRKVNQKVDLVGVGVTLGATQAADTLTLGTPKYLALAKTSIPKVDWTTAKPAVLLFSDSVVGIGGDARLNIGALSDPATPNKFIKLIFDNSVILSSEVSDVATINAAVVAGAKWLYNEEDGWFYYLGVLGSGQNTGNLLTALYLDKAAGNSYSYTNFDLTAKMDAIQAVDEALGTTGWALDTSTGHPTSILIVDYLSTKNAA